MRAFVLLFLVAGCGSGGDDACTTNCPTFDLAMRDLHSVIPGDDMPPAVDLVMPTDQSVLNDLTIPTDFSGYTFCAATNVASTCAQVFFQAVADCYPPPPMQCTIDTDNSTYNNLCFIGGEKMLSTIDPNTGKVHTVWSNMGKTCMTADIMPQKGNGSVDTFTVGPQMLVMGEAGGTVTCPDGSAAVIGANFGNCPDLQAILRGSKNCQAGVCQ
jgi:hypothetical protein